MTFDEWKKNNGYMDSTTQNTFTEWKKKNGYIEENDRQSELETAPIAANNITMQMPVNLIAYGGKGTDKPFRENLKTGIAQTPEAVRPEDYTRDNVESNRRRMEYLAGKSELTEDEKEEAEAAVKSLTRAAASINFKFSRTEEDAKNALDYMELSNQLKAAVKRVPTEAIQKSVSEASTAELKKRQKELNKFEIILDTDKKNAVVAEQSAVNKELKERELQDVISSVTGASDYAANAQGSAWDALYKKSYEDKYRYGEKNKWTYAAWQKSLRPWAWTDEEKAVYNYLYEKYGESGTEGFVDLMEERLNERTADMLDEKIAEGATAGSGKGVLNWIGSFGSNLSGVVSLPVQVGEGIINAVKGNGYQIDQNAPRYAMTRATDAIREAQGEKIESKSGKAAKFGYDVITSAVDSTLNAAIGAGIVGAAAKGAATEKQIANITSAIMGSEVASGTIISEMNAGSTAADATMTGIIRGAVEGITEEYSIEKIFSEKSKKAIINAARAAFAEGTEEISSNWLNRIVDALRDGDETEIKKEYYNYIAGGMSEQDALTAVIKGILKEDAYSFLAGGVSGLGINIVSGASRADARKDLSIADEENQGIAAESESVPVGGTSDAELEGQSKDGVKSETTAARSKDEILTEETKRLAEESTRVDKSQLAAFYQEKSRQYKSLMQNAMVADSEVKEEAYGELSDMLDKMAGNERDSIDQSESQQARDEIAEALALDGSNVSQVNEGIKADMTMGAEAQKGENYVGGNISDGGIQRNAGESTGEQPGGMAGGTKQAETKQKSVRFNQVRAAIERENRVRNIRKVSLASLGAKNGSAAETLRVIPNEQYDSELQEIESRFAQTGQHVSFVVGELLNQRGESVNAILLENGDVILQANNARWTATQLANHEAFHYMARMDSGMEAEAEKRIREKYTAEEFDRVVGVYMVELRSVYDMSDPEQAYEYVRGEILADAYAGMNAFGAGTDKFRGEVSKTVERRDASPATGTRGNTGNGSGGMPGDGYEKNLSQSDEGDNGTNKPLQFPNYEDIYNAERYSIDGGFAEKFDRWMAEKSEEERMTDGQTFTVGSTSDALKAIGVIDGKVRMRAGKIAEIMDKHPEMSPDTIKKIPEILEDPVLVMKSATRDDSIVLFSEQKAKDGKTVFVSVLLTPTKNSLYADDFSLVTSAYGRTKENIKNLIEKGELLFVAKDNNRAEAFLRSLGVQFPSDQVSLGSIGRITYEDGNVNIRGMKFSDWVSGKSVKNSTGERYSFTREQEEDDSPLRFPSFADEEYESDERYSAKTRKTPAEMSTNELRRSVREDKATLEAWDALDEQGELSEKMQAARNALRKSLEEERTELREREKQIRERKKELQEKTESETRPMRSIAKLKKDMISMFSVPMGSRGEIGNMIDLFADYVQKQGKISNAARNRLFQRLYDAGIVQIEAEENEADLRRSLTGSHLYVPESVKSEFGDDWNSFRGRAFGAGIFLTGDKGSRGIDSLYKEMDESFPGEFTTDETDQTTMLREIVGVAEAGKAQRLSLAEMMRRNENLTGLSVEEQIAQMRERMDRAVDAFAEMAGLEKELRAKTKNTVDGALAEIRAKERQKREQEQLKELQKKTLKSLQWLKKNQMKAPADLKKQFEEVLGDLDLYAISAANEMHWSKRHNATWRDIVDMYKDAEKNDPNFLPSAEIKRIVDRLELRKIGDMDVTALEDLYRMAQMLRTEYYNRNNVINDELHRTFQEVFDNSVQEIRGSGGKGHLGRSKTALGDKLTNAEMMTPINILEMMGGWKADGTWFSMGKQLQTGERHAKGYEVGAKAMLEEFIKSHEEWIKTADGRGKNAVWYEIEVPELLELNMGHKPIFGETKKVYMTPAQKVHMALEAENYQNLAHMRGGRTFADKKLYSDGKTAEAYAQGTIVKLAPETVKNIVKDLTEEERELYDVLKKYYNEYAKERINAVSNPLYGFDKAVTENYAPIFSDSNYTKFQAGIYDMTAEGVGHMKGRQQLAVNPSYNISAFDAFTRHVDQTKRFVGYAIPVRNVEKLINWRTADTSMMDEITHVWGKEGLDYVQNLIKELQSPKQRETSVLQNIGDKALGNYITAVFGANPGIVLKQFASYPAAAAVLGTGNMPAIKQIKNTDTELVAKYTPELEYRKLGYATPEVAELKKNPNWMDTNKITKFMFRGGAITWMDATTVKCLWPWAENYVKKNYPDLERGSDIDVQNGNSPFYKKVAEIYNDAVNTTQPMYDRMNRAKIMDNKHETVRVYTLFKTVPLQEYNTLRRYAGEMSAAKGGPEKKKAIRKFAEASLSVLLSTMMLEGIEAANQFVKNGLSAYRDDDDELTIKSFAEKFALKMAEDLAGITLVGDVAIEVAERIFGSGNAFGDIIEAPGVGQVEEILSDIVENAKYFGKLNKDVWNVADNGGSVEQYLKRNKGDIIGAIKDFSVELGKYTNGLPLENIEKYLTGIMSIVSPDLRQEYDDIMDTPTKSGLRYVSKKQLPRAIENYFGVRGIETEDAADEELARLYDAGYTNALPSDTPDNFKAAGESVVLTAYQKQVYDNEYKTEIANGINELIQEDAFIEVDDEMKTKMLNRLYEFASQSAKLVIREDYGADKWVIQGKAAIEQGVPVWAIAALQAQGFGNAKGKTIDYVESLDLTRKQKDVLISCKLGGD